MHTLGISFGHCVVSIQYVYNIYPYWLKCSTLLGTYKRPMVVMVSIGLLLLTFVVATCYSPYYCILKCVVQVGDCKN